MAFTEVEEGLKGKGYVIEFTHIPSGKNVSFKSFLTDFSDNFASSWGSEEIYGRADPLMIFKGTKRTITLAWDVVASSEKEAEENLQKISLLLTMLYPVYKEENNASSISSSPLFRVKFANLIQNAQSGEELIAAIDGFNYKPILDEGVFESEQMPNLYPKAVNLTCNMHILHTHSMGWDTNRKAFVNTFPYGEEHRESSPKEVEENSLDGTQEQREANQNKIIT